MEVDGEGVAVDEHVGVDLGRRVGQRRVHAQDLVRGAADLVDERLLAGKEHHGKEALTGRAVEGGLDLGVRRARVDLDGVGVHEVGDEQVHLLKLLGAAKLLPEPLRDLDREALELGAAHEVVLELAGEPGVLGELAVVGLGIAHDLAQAALHVGLGRAVVEIERGLGVVFGARLEVEDVQDGLADLEHVVGSSLQKLNAAHCRTNGTPAGGRTGFLPAPNPRPAAT